MLLLLFAVIFIRIIQKGRYAFESIISAHIYLQTKGMHDGLKNKVTGIRVFCSCLSRSLVKEHELHISAVMV